MPEDGKALLYAAFASVKGPIFSPVTRFDGEFTTKVPEGVNEQSYVMLTSCKERADDETLVAGPAIAEGMFDSMPLFNWRIL